MFIPMREYGKYGFINDTPASMLPIGAWNRARNVRFKGNYIERMLEPDIVSVDSSPDATFPTGAMWSQQFFDGSTPRFVVATQTGLWIVDSAVTAWVDVSGPSAPYQTPEDGYWQSFAWGNTVVFNNGIDPPQVYDPESNIFLDLPRWGQITHDDGTEDFDTKAQARWLIPYKSFIVAGNITEILDPLGVDDTIQPNAIWWSTGYQTPDLWKDPGTNTWDYNDPSTLAGKDLVGLEDGPLQWACKLGEGLMIYNSSSSTQMLYQGGQSVFDLRRLFDYGCTGIGGATEFLNQNLVVAGDVIYIHDGNAVTQIAEDRVRDWFYRNVRNLEYSVRATTDYSNREVVIMFDMNPDELVTNSENPNRSGLVFNYEDNNFTVMDASYDNGTDLENVECMMYALDLGQFSQVGGTWDQSNLPWDSYGEITWGQLQGALGSQAVRVSMYWLTNHGLYRANQLSVAAPNKSYLARKTNMDLNEIDPKMTTNLWKHIRQIYPHIVGQGTLRCRLGWSPNLETAPTWDDWVDYEMYAEGADPAQANLSDVKIDCRTTGRYLAIEWDFKGLNTMRFTGIDIDVIPLYGR